MFRPLFVPFEMSRCHTLLLDGILYIAYILHNLPRKRSSVSLQRALFIIGIVARCPPARLSLDAFHRILNLDDPHGAIRYQIVIESVHLKNACDHR